MQSIRRKWKSMRTVALHITANNTLAKLLAKHLAGQGSCIRQMHQPYRTVIKVNSDKKSFHNPQKHIRNKRCIPVITKKITEQE